MATPEELPARARAYGDGFGPLVMVRNVLEPQGRWDEFLAAFHDLVTRFNVAGDGRAEIESDYFLITVEP